MAQKAGERERLWATRRELSRTLRKSANFKLSEDVVVPRSRMAALLTLCAELANARGIQMPTYGHAGDGNLHVNLLWDDPRSDRRWTRPFARSSRPWSRWAGRSAENTALAR